MRVLLIVLALNLSLFSDIMLVGVYKDQNISGYVVSEKYDGVRGFWDGEKLLSKSGKRLFAPEFWTKEFPPFAIDGEIWSKRGEFEKILSIVTTKDDKSRWSELKFMVFDVPNAKGGLFERLEVLQKYLNVHPNSPIQIIKQEPIKDKKELKKRLKKVVDLGGEGLVVRDPKVGYIKGRSDKILKVKPYFDSECEVVAINDGKGKYKGMMGSITCKDGDVVFRIGGGFSDEMRANPPKLGTIVTYKFNSFTNGGKPKFARFLKIKKEIE